MLHLHEINTSVFPSEIQLEMPALQILSKSWARDRWLLRKLCRSTGLRETFRRRDPSLYLTLPSPIERYWRGAVKAEKVICTKQLDVGRISFAASAGNNHYRTNSHAHIQNAEIQNTKTKQKDKNSNKCVQLPIIGQPPTLNCKTASSSLSG